MQRQQLESRNRVHELGIQEFAVFRAQFHAPALPADGGRFLTRWHATHSESELQASQLELKRTKTLLHAEITNLQAKIASLEEWKLSEVARASSANFLKYDQKCSM
jgi:hypothetical protein